jgi:light-regulated signal transduction histidine kinase (bacteriophytochrome)
MKQEVIMEDRQLSQTSVGSQITGNQIQNQPANYYQIDRQLEQKISHKTAEVVQVVKELSVKNQELKIVNKQLENFACTVSHDLQEPLRSINMFTQLLDKEYGEKLDEQAKEYINYIIGSAERMQSLIRDVLVYSRTGKSETTWLNVDLNQLINNVTLDLQGIIQETEAKIIIHNLPTVLVNPTEISQLFSNLITNSIKFKSQQKPRIEILSQLKEDYWLISVKDNGIGIDRQYQDKIFHAFKKLHSQAQYSGNGVGLAICQKIVERHQGKIGVKSQLGKGAVFYFTLPNK